MVVTTAIVTSSSPEVAHALLLERSTNLEQLAGPDPWRALIQAPFFVGGWLGLLGALPWLLFVSAPVERWLGSWRWLLVWFLGEVGISLLVAALLRAGVDSGAISESVRTQLDVGASYAYYALAGVFSWRLARPWRFVWLAALLLDLVLKLALSPSSTALGHLLCFCLGVALLPLTWSAPVRRRGDDGAPKALYPAVAEIWLRPFTSG
jgi:membrane associated rhomboid family serine protease